MSVKPGSQNARLLAVLRDGPATNAEIHARAGHMIVNSRVSELRDKGYEIDCDQIGATGASAFLYTLVSEPEEIGAGSGNGGLTDGAPPADVPASTQLALDVAA